ITAASGKPATTASTGMIEALHALGTRRIAPGAPWTADVNRTTAAFIQASGFDVIAQEALGLVRNLEIGLLDPQSGYDVGRRVDRPDADVVMLACGNWNVFDAIAPLERDLGKPVLTTNQVGLWHALKIIGAAPLDGLGVLLHEHLDAVPAARDGVACNRAQKGGRPAMKIRAIVTLAIGAWLAFIGAASAQDLGPQITKLGEGIYVY